MHQSFMHSRSTISCACACRWRVWENDEEWINAWQWIGICWCGRCCSNMVTRWYEADIIRQWTWFVTTHLSYPIPYMHRYHCYPSSIFVCAYVRAIDSLASSVDHTAGVYFVPAFAGLKAPYWRDDARGYAYNAALLQALSYDMWCSWWLMI